MKRYIVSGGSGFIGGALVRRLVERGDAVTVLTRGSTRSGNPRHVHWDPYNAGPWSEELEAAEGVVHLAGERAVGVRFTEAVKRGIRDSRVLTTENLVRAIERCSTKPAVLVCASGVGFYGDRPAGERMDETGSAGGDFLARVCVEWEAAARRVTEAGVRWVSTRFGIVLGPGGGALETLVLPFKLFVGGSIGSGEQGVSWIQLDDAVAALLRCLDDAKLSGPVNVTSPHPVSNAELSAEIARALHRPNWLKAPSFGIKALFGEGAVPILTGQYALPARLQAAGFEFRYPELRAALEFLENRSP
jgi:hypothetical protein